MAGAVNVKPDLGASCCIETVNIHIGWLIQVPLKLEAESQVVVAGYRIGCQGAEELRRRGLLVTVD